MSKADLILTRKEYTDKQRQFTSKLEATRDQVICTTLSSVDGIPGEAPYLRRFIKFFVWLAVHRGGSSEIGAFGDLK